MMVKNQLLKKFNWIIELRSWVYPVTLIFMFNLSSNQRQQKKPRFKIAAFYLCQLIIGYLIDGVPSQPMISLTVSTTACVPGASNLRGS